MNKKLWLSIFLIPAMRSGVAILQMQDANNTGKDDDAARALAAAVTGLEAWLST